ncbi:type II toxin-antitoxin system VapC family toxin [Candidatus Woesearchaeota archaeon]|nr:type II toxin-antitoxin system VapC family toxin [Candidatus Woesearchaeota archaeon]
MKLLDTTFLIDFLEGKLQDLNILNFLEEEKLCTTYLNIYEVIIGIFYSGKEINKKIEKANIFFDRLKILNLNENSSIISAKIRANLIKSGEEIQHIDCLISGIALENGVNTIITKNKKHFEKIHGIKVEDY